MDKDQLQAVIVDCLKDIAPEADVGALDPDETFHDQLDIDSVDFVNLMLSLESALGVRITEVDYPKLSSLAGCIAYLLPLLQEKQGA